MDQGPLSGSSSPIEAGFNVVNTIIGSGILALPYALREAGFYFGIFSLVIIAYICRVTLNTLIYSGRRTGLYRYEDVSEAALGRLGYILFCIGLSVNSIGSCISYLIIVGDITTVIVQQLFGEWWLTSRSSVITIAAVGFTLPLLFFRTLEPLIRPSALSIFCLPVIVGIIAVRGPKYISSETPPMPVFGPSILPAVGVIAFAYAGTQTCFQSYQTLKYKSLDGWHKATGFAISIAVTVYLAFSVISYISFGLNTQPNLLNNFAVDDGWANVARVLLSLTLTLTYPMQFYPVRDLIGSICGFSPYGTLSSAFKFHAVSMCLFSATLIIALTVSDLGFVFKLIGTAASSILVFGLPGIIYLRLASPYSKNAPRTGSDEEATALLNNEPLDSKVIPEPSTSVLSAVILAIGGCVLVIGSWTTISDFILS